MTLGLILRRLYGMPSDAGDMHGSYIASVVETFRFTVMVKFYRSMHILIDVNFVKKWQ